MGDIDEGVAAADAFVFFGATGDLAHKMIFPALYQMVKRGTLGVPVIGVASSGWGLPQLRDRARDSIARTSAGIDETIPDAIVGTKVGTDSTCWFPPIGSSGVTHRICDRQRALATPGRKPVSMDLA